MCEQTSISLPGKRRRRWWIWLAIAPFILFLMLCALLYMPPIQRFAVDKASGLASDATGLDITVGHLSLRFPLDLVVDDVYAVTREERDTLLAVDRIMVDVQILPLLGKQIEIDEVSLKGASVDSRDFIEGMKLEGSLGELFLESHGVGFDPNLAVVNEFLLKDTDLSLTLENRTEADTAASEPVLWKIQLDDIILENVALALHMPQDSLCLEARLPEAVLKDGLVDLEHAAYSMEALTVDGASVACDVGLPLAFENIGLELNAFYYCGQDIRAEVKRFGWKERSGIELLTTEGSIVADADGLSIPSFVMKTAHSSVDLRTEMDWDVLAMKKEGKLAALLDVEIGKEDVVSLLAGRDTLFRHVYPNGVFTLKADVGGDLDRLRLKDFSAGLPGAFGLKAEGDLMHLADSLRRGGEINLNAEAFDMSFLERVTDGSLALPAGTGLTGNFTVAGSDMEADLWLKQPKEEPVEPVDSLEERFARVVARYNLANDAYRADLVVNNLNLHEFLPKDSIFEVAMDLHMDGEGMDFLAPETFFNVSGKVDRVHYSQFRLTGYNLAASLKAHQLDAALTAHNSAMEVVAHLDGKLKTGDVAAHLEMNIPKLDWHTLQLVEVPFLSSHKLDVYFVSDLQQKYVLDASMKDTSVKLSKRTLKPKDLFVGFSTSADSTSAYMRAGDLDVDFEAEGYAETLLQQVDVLTKHMEQQWTSKTIVQEELKELLPDVRLKAVSGKDNPICNYLNSMQGVGFDSFRMDLETSPEEGLNGEMFVYSLHTDSMVIDTVYVDLKHGAEGLDFLTGVASGPKKNQEAFEVFLDGSISNGKAEMLLQYLNARKEKGVYLGVDAELRRRGIRMKLFPEKPILIYRPFDLNERNFVYLTDKGRFYGDVRLYDEQGTGIHFYTNREDTIADQEMTVELAKIDLKEFRRILPYMPQVDGRLGGEAHYVDSQGQMMLSADLKVDDFVYEGSPMGNWEAGGVYLPGDDMEHHIDGYVRHNGQEITYMNGIYRMSRMGDENIEGHLELSHFPLDVVNPFVPDKTVELTGTLDGTLSMEGNPMKPKLNGVLAMDSVHLAMPDLSVKFRFDDKQVRMTDSRMVFDKFNIYTEGDTPFAVNGAVDFSDLENLRMDLRMKANDYELMNAKKTRNATMYGKIYVDVDATLKGPVEELVMRGNMNVLGKTDFTYVLKDSPLAVNDRLGDMVTFVNFNDTVTVEEVEPEVALTGLDIAMTIHIDQAVQAHVDLTADGSNYMLLEGGGDLAFQYTPQGEMRLNGRYLLMSGELKYEIPVIPLKTFDIQSGSYMNWTGNPMNPEMNIKATERVRASVGSDGVASRMVSFDVGIALTERLENLGLAFTLEAPDDGEVQEQLNAMGAEERGKLAVTMLVTGMYLAEGNATGGFNVNNALNSYLQNQISDIAGKTLDISLGMESVDDAEGNKRTDYNFQFAKRFWNNRFRIVIGGTVSTGNTAQKEETFIDNVAIEYRLDDSGTRYVKLFHDKNYESVLEGEVIETGVGIVLRKKVSKLGELFIFKKKQENEEETDD